MNILIVDDIKSWRDFHTYVLRNIYPSGADIDFASSAREGYNLALNYKTKIYDLIISDLQMESDYEPEHAGEWMVREIKLLDKYKNTPIIIISASYDIDIVAQKLGVEFIKKSSLIANPQLLRYKLEEFQLL